MNAQRLPAPEGLEVTMSSMRRRHLRAVLKIESQVYPRPWTLGLFMSELALRPTRLYIVARINGNVVGYAGMLLAAGEAHVTTIAVDPGWHRHKIGSRLLLTLARAAVERQASALTLEVRVSNRPAQQMYERFGFAPAGIRKNYYSETNEDAIIMWAHDISGEEYGDRLDAIEDGVPGITVVEDLSR